jgi:hypothetical protein
LPGELLQGVQNYYLYSYMPNKYIIIDFPSLRTFGSCQFTGYLYHE